MLQRMSPTRTGGLDQYTSVRPLFDAYQTSTDGIVDEFYLDGISQTITKVGNGNAVLRADAPPASVDTTKNIYSPTSQNKPLVPFSRRYYRIIGTAATDGAKFVFDSARNFQDAVDNNGYFHVVANSPAGTAVTAKIILRSTTGNEEAYTLTTSSKNWDSFSFKLGDVSLDGEGVKTGTLDYAAIKEVEIQVAGSINIAYGNATGEMQNKIGYLLTWVPPCLDENPFEETVNQDTIEMLCDGKAADKVVKDKKFDFTFNVAASDMLIKAMLGSNVIKYRNDTIQKNIVEPANNKTPISDAGTFTLSNGLVAKNIIIDKTVLNKVDKISLLDANSFVQVGNLITLTTDYAGTPAENFTIIGTQVVSGNTLEKKGSKTSLVGRLQITKVNKGKTEVDTWYRVSINNISKTNGDQDKYKIDMSAYAVNDSWGWTKEM